MNKEELRQQYNPDGSLLRAEQLRMLDMLKCIDGICKKHNIQYWLSSGTLLGAVRHGGFIPWDDDLDIEMQREDYRKFLKIIETELPESYVVQSHKTDKKYVYHFIKIRDLKSMIVECDIIAQQYKYKGVFIDIFPLEKSSYYLSRIAGSLFYRLCIYPMKLTPMLFYVSCFFRVILMNIIFPFFRVLSMWNTDDIVRHSFGATFYAERNLHDIFPLSKIKFEDSYFNAPCNSDVYLKKIYGDYMKIPSHIPSHNMLDKIKMW